MGRRKSAQTDIIGKLGFGFTDSRELASKHQIFAEGQRKNAERHIPASKVGGDFRGHHPRVGACDIQVNIKVGRQGVYNLFPSLDLLYLVQKQVGLSVRAKTLLQLCVHLLCRHILKFHRIITAAYHAFSRNIPLAL